MDNEDWRAAAQELEADLRAVLDDLSGEYHKDREKYRAIWAPLTIKDVKRFAASFGAEELKRLLVHDFKNGVGTSAGHPDITLLDNDGAKFVEVKTTDRLRRSQARWVFNVARPLGLDVAVARVRCT